ncbi:cytochrome c oxidase subunit 3 [Ilumatobacter coccineus]|jgi:cytochrome c oxidase subunit III|uniref:cytochrome-c oxidase n=1 Tax=Ilumatobacter coccineus (strain NBRC 103263 / KCTC 29153 / YM16-304) TaxID=1313172 RepID=A0A6C7E952_ILUCY|nr:cytochrome c oxidase subunit 3 [Ilumatobacter coccineus]BAN04184.1 putative cytochrome c oxidase subunit III [Ilumatobacter coccineus YM16-304]
MEALTAGPAPAPRNQMIVGATLASMATLMLTGGMLGVWALQRRQAIDTDGAWLPSSVTIPEVPANVMLIAFIAVCSFAQWAVWAAKRNDRANTVFALGATAFVAVLIVNAQAYIYSQIELSVTDGAYGSMFFAVTGTFMAMMIAGIAFSLVAAFRLIGGRIGDREILTAHAIFWYALAAVFSAIWFVVYVVK